MPIFGPKLPKMHILDQIWPFWAKNPNSYGRKQNFWYPHNENMSALFLVGHWIKWAKNANIRPKMSFFGQIWPKTDIFVKVKVLVSSYQGANVTPFLCWKHWLVQLKLAARDENVQFWPENLDIRDQKLISCMKIAILSIGHITSMTGLQLSHSDHPQKISVSELWVIIWGSPLFLAISGLCHFAIISTLNFGPFSTKLGGNVQVI